MFVIVMNEYDKQLLLSQGYNQIRTFIQGLNTFHCVLVRGDGCEIKDLSKMGLQGGYVITSSLAF